MKIILSPRRHQYLAIASIFLIVVALIAGMVGCGSRPAVNAIEIRDWYDLSAIANNITADYVLENDLDATTAGWEELASPTANGGKGWKPIVGSIESPPYWFTGVFDGQGHEIKDLFINRPDKDLVGLFSYINSWGLIRNIGVVDADVTGGERVGGLVGETDIGTVSNSYFSGTVTGSHIVGGLAGGIWAGGIVSDSYATGAVIGGNSTGGLIGFSDTGCTVSLCHFDGTVTGDERVGGLVGNNQGIVSGSYSTSTVTGNKKVGGLAGLSLNTTSNCYATGDVTGDWGVGGLIGNNEGTVNDSYATGNVTGNFRVGGLAGAIWEQGSVSNCYATGDVTGNQLVGGLVGTHQGGIINNSYSTGSVTGDALVGGLVGDNWGTVSNSYSTGSVTGGLTVGVGGLVGMNDGIVAYCFWDTETSGQATSDGGTGKNTTEMQDITTFTDTGTEGLDEPWDITAVANPSTRNPAYIWNIVDDETYPFLSWES